MLHPYATDSEERTKIPFLVAGIAVALAFLIHKSLDAVNWSSPWWIDFSSPLLLYGAFLYFFDHVGWKWGWLRKIGIVKVPNLSGEWQGSLRSSFDEFSREHAAIIHIEQTWTRITIKLQSASSESLSVVAGLMLNSPDGKILSYQYRSEPRANAVDTMQTHLGTTWVAISKTNGELEGKYYSGRGRQNHGSISLTRKQ